MVGTYVVLRYWGSIVVYIVIITINDNDFLFTDSRDVLFDKRRIWFSGLNC